MFLLSWSSSNVTDLSLLVLLLPNHRWSPLLRLQFSDCSNFCIMYGVPSTVVCCSESIGCIPGTDSKFFFKHLLLFQWVQLLPVKSQNACSDIRYISIHYLLYFSLLSASLRVTLVSAGIAKFIGMHYYYYCYYYYYYSSQYCSRRQSNFLMQYIKLENCFYILTNFWN